MSTPDAPKTKDAWDRAGALAPLITPIVVAAIGGWFTYNFNQNERARREMEFKAQQESRVREVEVSRANQEQQHKIRELEVVEKFFSHLTGSDRLRQRAAVVAIATLARPELATKLAALIDSEGTREGAEVVNASVSSSDATRSSVTVPPPSSTASSGRPSPERWVYLGEYVRDKGIWKTRYVGIGERDLPDSLTGQVVEVRRETGTLNVRNRPLGDIVGSLSPDSQLQISEVQDFAQLGYMWARVTYR